MEKNSYEAGIEAIQQAAQGYAASGKSPEKILEEAVEWLYETYEKTGDKDCLYSAKKTIQAYLQLGLLYDHKKELFDRVLGALGEEAAICFPRKLFPDQRIRGNRAQIRHALGYWPRAAKKEESVETVVNQILERIQMHEAGATFFRCERTNDLFELLILANEIYLIDFKRNRVYYVQ